MRVNEKHRITRDGSGERDCRHIHRILHCQAPNVVVEFHKKAFSIVWPGREYICKIHAGGNAPSTRFDDLAYERRNSGTVIQVREEVLHHLVVAFDPHKSM